MSQSRTDNSRLRIVPNQAPKMVDGGRCGIVIVRIFISNSFDDGAGREPDDNSGIWRVEGR